MPKKIITWIVVADGAHAKVFMNEGPGRGLKPALDREFAASHPKVEAIVSDRHGRHQTPAAGGRHAIDPETDPRRQLELDFAKDIARMLDEAALKGRYDRLVLVAPPRTLGDLRAELDKHARARLAHEVDKDLVHLDAREVARHLADILI